MLRHILRGVDVEKRAAAFAALGDPSRLRIVDLLRLSDLSPGDITERLGLDSNLVAHHLRVLERADLVRRVTSSGDGRRRYVQLVDDSLASLLPSRGGTSRPRRVLFVCTRNSARSQLAAALWRTTGDGPADSAGTHPADRIHPGAVAAARRAGLRLDDETPKHLSDVRARPSLVVTVCDEAHEELEPGEGWLHWSIPDPVRGGRASQFDDVIRILRRRIELLTETTNEKESRA